MSDPLHLHDTGPVAHYDPETESYTVECRCGHVTEPVKRYDSPVVRSGKRCVDMALDLFYRHAVKEQAREIRRMKPVVEAVLALKHGEMSPALIAGVMDAVAEFELDCGCPSADIGLHRLQCPRSMTTKSISIGDSKTEAQRQARKQTYEILVKQGLPIPPDLAVEFEGGDNA